jgi:hypothetical protein
LHNTINRSLTDNVADFLQIIGLRVSDVSGLVSGLVCSSDTIGGVGWFVTNREAYAIIVVTFSNTFSVTVMAVTSNLCLPSSTLQLLNQSVDSLFLFLLLICPLFPTTLQPSNSFTNTVTVRTKGSKVMESGRGGAAIGKTLLKEIKRKKKSKYRRHGRYIRVAMAYAL